MWGYTNNKMYRDWSYPCSNTTCEAFIAHNLPHNLFNISHPHAKVLVAVPTAHSHVVTIDESVLDRCRNPFVEVCVDVGWVEVTLFSREQSCL